MERDQRNRDRGAQEITTGEREAADRAKQKDKDIGKRPVEGRDVPPEGAGKPKRDPNSPWMGGG
jgi:hypothetical protein